MDYLGVMITAVITACLGVHLDLFNAITSVLTKISSCAKCSSFWCSVVLLWYVGADVISIVSLSLLAAYISNWVGFILVIANKYYTKLWEKLSQKQ